MAALSNLRHEAFCLEYAVDFNATKAAERAGYKAGSASRVLGYRLLARPNIQKRIAELMERRRDAIDVTVQGVVERLNRTANACLQLVPKRDSQGEVVAMVPVNATGGLKALEMLARHLAMFIDRRQEIPSDQVIEIEWQAPLDKNPVAPVTGTRQ